MFKRRSAVIYAALVLIFLTLSISAAVVHASEMRDIELTDGTVIEGEVVSMSNGVYTISSAALGTIQIDGSKVRAIRAKGAPVSPGASGDQVRSLQEKMMGDRDIMDIIEALQNDQDLQEIMRDPEIIKAVRAADLTALMANPGFMKLLNKLEIQQIKDKISR